MGFIKFKVEVDVKRRLMMRSFKSQNKTTKHVQLAIEDSYKRLLNPAISNEAFAKLRLIPILFRFLLIIWDNSYLWEKNNFSD
jgi:hypothetical protein